MRIYANFSDRYHRILETAGAEERERLYLELLVEPWKPMMEMMRGGFAGPQDGSPLAGARALGWAFPDQTDLIADLLGRLERADAWRVGREALARAVACFAPYAAQIPFDQIEGWLVLADPARSNPLAAHEMHHLIRMRTFPFGMNTSVADYIVIEGTAESFAASLFGEDKVGCFITEFDQGEFETARVLIGKSQKATGFNVIRGFIFGDALAEQAGFQPVDGMPTYGGYTIGYHAVQAFLRRSGKTIEEATFLPAREILDGSGFFG